MTKKKSKKAKAEAAKTTVKVEGDLENVKVEGAELIGEEVFSEGEAIEQEEAKKEVEATDDFPENDSGDDLIDELTDPDDDQAPEEEKPTEGPGDPGGPKKPVEAAFLNCPFTGAVVARHPGEFVDYTDKENDIKYYGRAATLKARLSQNPVKTLMV